MSRVLVIGDTHLPAAHPGYLKFCRDLETQYKCDTVVHIGDICDFQAISFHAKNPEMPGPKDEFDLTFSQMRPWVKAFPKARLCIGNHDARVIRLAESVSIPSKFIRDYKEVWDTPGWQWKDYFCIDEVKYTHGTGYSGLHPAFTALCKCLSSVVIGHIHHAAGIKWRANTDARYFGMDVGTGVDDKALAFAYARHNPIRSMLSAGVVLDGTPLHIIMPAGPGEKYHHSKFRHTKGKR